MSDRRPRALYVAWVHDNGVPARGPSYEQANFLPSLRAVCESVDVFDLGRVRSWGPSRLSEELLRVVDDGDFDLMFVCLVTEDLDRAVVRRITERGDIVTFNWFSDDHWRWDTFSRHWAPCFTWVSTTDRAALEHYHAAGQDNVLLTQWAVAESVYRPHGRELRYDVSFVGQRYGDRLAVLDQVRRSGVHVEVRGTGWAARPWHRAAGRLPVIRSLGGAAWAERARASTRVDVEGMVALFEQSRVNLNLAASSHGTRAQIKGRVFEVPAAGGFLLTEDAEALADYLVPEREVGVFHSPDELVERIRWWLAHEDERQQAAAAGHARVLAEHTYTHRFRALFDGMGVL